MSSGKTSRLLADLSRYADVGRRCKFITSDTDTRKGHNGVSCHSSQFHKVSERVHCTKTKALLDVDVKEDEVVAADETHFFADLEKGVLHWLEVLGKEVIITGLDGDINRNPIGRVLFLVPFADTVEKLSAFCDMCAAEGKYVKAPFTIKHNQPEVKKEESATAVIDVGGKEKYKSVCRKHYLLARQQ